MSVRVFITTSFLALFAFTGTASAEQASSVAERLVRLDGVTLGWPATGAGLITPGTELVVRVLENGSAQRVRVTLTRLDGRDRIVARASLRRGSFRAHVAHRVGARYVLRAAVGQRRHESRFSVASPPGACADVGGTASAELRLDAISGRAGEPVSATLVNTGSTCLTSGLKLEWEARQPDGAFLPAPAPGPPTLEAYGVRPGEIRAFFGTVWSTLQPGEHRAVLRAIAGERIVVVASGPFTIVP